jgi:hypothetical protein
VKFYDHFRTSSQLFARVWEAEKPKK